MVKQLFALCVSMWKGTENGWSLRPLLPRCVTPCCRSFIEVSNCLSKSQAEEAIEAMLQAAGFDCKDKITWEDFHCLLHDHEKELKFAQLNIKGKSKQGKKEQEASQASLAFCPRCVPYRFPLNRDGDSECKTAKQKPESVLHHYRES